MDDFRRIEFSLIQVDTSENTRERYFGLGQILNVREYQAKPSLDFDSWEYRRIERRWKDPTTRK